MNDGQSLAAEFEDVELEVVDEELETMEDDELDEPEALVDDELELADAGCRASVITPKSAPCEVPNESVAEDSGLETNSYWA